MFVWVVFFFLFPDLHTGRGNNAKVERVGEKRALSLRSLLGLNFKKDICESPPFLYAQRTPETSCKNVPDFYLQVSLVAASRPQSLPLRTPSPPDWR